MGPRESPLGRRRLNSWCIPVWEVPVRGREMQIGLWAIGRSSFSGLLPLNVEIVTFTKGWRISQVRGL